MHKHVFISATPGFDQMARISHRWQILLRFACEILEKNETVPEMRKSGLDNLFNVFMQIHSKKDVDCRRSGPTYLSSFWYFKVITEFLTLIRF